MNEQNLTLALHGLRIITDFMFNVIGDVLLSALPVMGAIVVIGIGVKVFKRFTK